MTKVIDTLKASFFWGLLVFLLLVFGFSVNINNLWTEVISGHVLIRIISAFLLISPVLYIFIVLTRLIKDGRRTGYIIHIGTEFISNFWPIFMVFCMHWFDSKVYVIFRTVLWWGMMIFGVCSVCFIEGNSIIKAINCFENQEIWRRLGIFGICCLVLFGIAVILWVISGKKIREFINAWDD